MTTENKAKRFYSAATNGFYVADVHATMPDDVVEIAAEHHAALMLAQSEGASIVLIDGAPQASPLSEPGLELQKAWALNEVRFHRAQVLATLDGLQVSAVVTGASGDAEAIEEIKQGLRDITALDLSKEKTPDGIKRALTKELKRLAGKAPKKAFDSVLAAREH